MRCGQSCISLIFPDTDGQTNTNVKMVWQIVSGARWKLWQDFWSHNRPLATVAACWFHIFITVVATCSSAAAIIRSTIRGFWDHNIFSSINISNKAEIFVVKYLKLKKKKLWDIWTNSDNLSRIKPLTPLKTWYLSILFKAGEQNLMY